MEARERKEAQDMPEADLTVEEVAALLKVHPETVRVWLRSRIFPNAYHLPGRAGWRVPQADIDALKKEVA
jgi:excisionase family DNA binding protein